MSKEADRPSGEIGLDLLEANVGTLEEISDQLMLLMESQSRAVVHSDADRLETLTEEQVDLISRFRKEKEKIETVVRELLSRRSSDKPDGNWSALVECWPEKRKQLEAWRDRLASKTDQVSRKQKQVQELLVFARTHNEHLLKTLFRRDDREKGSYLESGKTQGPSSGMTINREV